MAVIDKKKFKTGDLVAFTTWGIVTKYKHENVLEIQDCHTGEEIDVLGTQLINRLESGDVYENKVYLNRTEILKILIHSFNKPFTVSFVKKDGTDRVLRGRLVHTDEALMGRSMAEDLDIKDGHKLRQIDHRTLNWLIVDGVKYVVR